MSLPDRVEIVEVGMRDGLQIESEFVPTDTKIQILNALIDAGVRHFEATSFVSPRAVPQMRDAQEVLQGVRKRPGVVLGRWRPTARASNARCSRRPTRSSCSCPPRKATTPRT